MNKGLWFALLVVLTFSVKSFALENVEIGVRLGGEGAINNVGLYSSAGQFMPTWRDAQMRKLSISFAGMVYSDFAFSDVAILSIGGYFSIFRSYDLMVDEGGLAGEQTATFHNFALDIVYKSRFKFNERFALVTGIGLGPTFNTKPSYRIAYEDGSSSNDSIVPAKLYVGLNMIGELALNISVAGGHELYVGVRAASDLLNFAYKKGVPSVATTEQSAITPMSVMFYLGYGFRF